MKSQETQMTADYQSELDEQLFAEFKSADNERKANPMSDERLTDLSILEYVEAVVYFGKIPALS